MGSKFKCNYSGHGKPGSQVFDDKNLDLLKQNGWGGGGKKLTKNWADREKAYNELMRIMGQKVQRQLLSGRTGGEAGSQAEPVRVEDERVDNENQDNSSRPDKEMGESGGGGGGGGGVTTSVSAGPR